MTYRKAYYGGGGGGTLWDEIINIVLPRERENAIIQKDEKPD